MSDCDKKGQLFSILTGLLYPAILGAVIYDAWKLFFLEVDKHPTFGSGALVIVLIALYVVDFSYAAVRHDSTYSGKKFLGDCTIVFSLFFAIKLVLAEVPCTNAEESLKRSFPRFAECFPFVSDSVFWLFMTKILSVFWEKQVAEETENKKNNSKITWENFHRLFSNVFKLSCLCYKPHNKMVGGRSYDQDGLDDYGVGTDAAFMYAYLLLMIGWGYMQGFGNSWLDGSHPYYVWGLVLVVFLDVLFYWQYDRLDKGLKK
jgi:hypothetical protein